MVRALQKKRKEEKSTLRINVLQGVPAQVAPENEIID
jgi:hypothetical protein